MDATFPREDIELQEAFEIIASIESFKDYINDITELIYKNNLSKETINKVLQEHEIHNINNIKEDLLDLLIVYINLVLKDHVITKKEFKNIKMLKLYFNIREGDFYNLRYHEMKEILQKQFERLYYDNVIDIKESILNVELQEIFGLSYDQFDRFKAREIISAVKRGADITDLDTALNLGNFSDSDNDFDRNISREVKDMVWNRDGGKCCLCGSNEKLEFDHIIPFSKGGSNTYRNIQLLCESCNRSKSDRLG